MKNLIFIALSLLIFGCAAKPNPKTPSYISKLGILHKDRMEATPFIWNDGRLLLMVAARELSKIEIYDDQTLVTSFDSSLGLASAIMDNGKLYIFGTIDWKNAATNAVQMISTTDLITWTAPVTVLPTFLNRTYFNSSVTKMPNGSFVMAVETCEPGTICFNARFYSSNDLITWTEIGTIFKPRSYAACPTIRFVDGFYYVFYLRAYDGLFVTHVSRSTDLISWEDGGVVLSPLDGDGEGNNASDMDFTEYNGELIINYGDGDQLTWSNIRTAKYQGTLESFVKSFFKSTKE